MLEGNNLTEKPKMVDNEAYRERFQFLLSVNDNIICQRYFKIYGFNNEAVGSLEFKEAMDDIVRTIQSELVSKSRIFMWYTRNYPLKLTGFVNDLEKRTEDDVIRLTYPYYNGETTLSDGTVVNKSYFTYDDSTEDSYSDNEKLNDWEVTFKFQVKIDDHTVYEQIWDGTVYPKYVRNGVDLTNSDASYRDKDPSSLHFGLAIIRHMTYGRSDLVYNIIKRIIDATSYNEEDEEPCSYTKFDKYGDNNYRLSKFDKEWIDAARKATNEKTRAYYSELNREEKYASTYGLTAGQYDFIEKNL